MALVCSRGVAAPDRHDSTIWRPPAERRTVAMAKRSGVQATPVLRVDECFLRRRLIKSTSGLNLQSSVVHLRLSVGFWHLLEASRAGSHFGASKGVLLHTRFRAFEAAVRLIRCEM